MAVLTEGQWRRLKDKKSRSGRSPMRLRLRLRQLRRADDKNTRASGLRYNASPDDCIDGRTVEKGERQTIMPEREIFDEIAYPDGSKDRRTDEKGG